MIDPRKDLGMSQPETDGTTESFPKEDSNTKQCSEREAANGVLTFARRLIENFELIKLYQP